MAFGKLPIMRGVAARRDLCRHPAVQNILGTPLHTLVFDRAQQTHTKNIKQHLWTGELPAAAIQEYDFVGQVTSPLFTLFTLTRSLTLNQLAMAMYEFCGTFTVYKPTPEIERAFADAGQRKQLKEGYGWKCVVDYEGKTDNLWRREPLIELHELQEFAQLMKGVRGGRKFAAAAKMVSGVAASPLEAQASLLIGAPRARGGRGIKLQNNEEIHLTRSAKLLYPGATRCYADLYALSPKKDRAVDIECQGRMIHTGDDARVSDAERTTALESMGIDVIQITYRHLADPDSFESLMEHICQSLKLRPKERSKEHVQAEKQLRDEIFVPWETLGDPTARLRRAKTRRRK